MKPQLPPTIEKYVRATNGHDAASFIKLFDDNALVQDNGREFRGTAAIKSWSESEIFDVKVTLDVVEFTNRDGEAIFTAKVDGTFDRTGLPEPLFISHYFAIRDDKIVRLRCQLANEEKGN